MPVPMHSTPLPPLSAPDSTLCLAFPPKTPGGTRHGSMDDWLDGIDLSGELLAEEEVLVGFGERRGNLFGVDEIEGITWVVEPRKDEGSKRDKGKGKASSLTVDQPPKQLPTPSPEPGSVPLPSTSTVAVDVHPPANAVASSSRQPDQPRRESRRQAISERPPPPSTLQVPTTDLVLPLRDSQEKRKRLRSPPPPVEHASSRKGKAPEGAIERPARPPAEPSRSHPSTQPAHVASEQSQAAPPPQARRASPRRPSSSRLTPTSTSRPLANSRQPTRSVPPPPTANDSFQSHHSTSFIRSDPPKDDFFARRLRDSYIGPVGITGLNSSSPPSNGGGKEGDDLRREIAALRTDGMTVHRRRAQTPQQPAVAPLSVELSMAKFANPPTVQPPRERRKSAGESVMAFFTSFLARSISDASTVIVDSTGVPSTPVATTSAERLPSQPFSSKRPRARSPSPPPAKRARPTIAPASTLSQSRPPLEERRRGDGNARPLPSASASATARSSTKSRPPPTSTVGKRPLAPPTASTSAQRRLRADASSRKVTQPQPFSFQPSRSRPAPPPPPAERHDPSAPPFKAHHTLLELQAQARSEQVAAQRRRLALERERINKALFSGLEERMSKRMQWDEEVRKREEEKEVKRREEDDRKREREKREQREERKRTIVVARPVPDGLYSRRA